MSGERPYRVAVVGATGLVGTAMLETLAARGFPAAEIVPLASERSAGRELAGGLVVRALGEDEIEGFDLAIFSAGATVSREWAPRFARAGAVVVDNSSCWRTDPEVPLVVAEVNPEDLDSHRGIVANPNCSTMQLMVALRPIQRAAGIERLIVSTYQSVSGTASPPSRSSRSRRTPSCTRWRRRRRRSTRTRSPSTCWAAPARSRTGTTTPTRSAR